MNITTVSVLRDLHRGVRAALVEPAAVERPNGLLRLVDAADTVWLIRVPGGTERPILLAVGTVRTGLTRLSGIGCVADGLPLGKASGVLAFRRATGRLRDNVRAVPADENPVPIVPAS